MNLHGVASPAIAAINPMISATLRRSTGYTTAADGTRTPTTSDSTIIIQLQGASDNVLTQLNELNIGGILQTVYANGSIQSIDRKDGLGGDLLIIGSTTWLVVHALGQWPDWCYVAIQKQVDA